MVNSRESLAKIPSMNNDANPYIITLDTYKEGYWAYDISNYYKGRVDDNGTPFMVRWFEHGQLKNVQGLRPFIRGTVGQHTIDDQTDPDNPKVVPSSDCSQIDQTGETTDTAPGGIAIYRMVNACFTQEGMFYGEIGLKDSSGIVLSSVDIAFKVLGGRMNMIGARKFYVSEFEKALDNLNEIIEKTKNDFSQELRQVIDDARNEYLTQTKASHDANVAADAEINAIRADAKDLADQIGSQQDYINAHNIVTTDKFDDLSNSLTKYVTESFVQPEAYNTLDELQRTYPSGAKGIFVVIDTGHFYVWQNNVWKDCGSFQSAGIANGSIHLEKLSSSLQNGFYPNVEEIKINNYNTGYINSADGKIKTDKSSDPNDGDPVHTDMISVNPDEEYYICTQDYWNGKAVIFFNQDKMIGSFPDTNDVQRQHIKITIPHDVNGIILNGTRQFRPRLFKINNFFEIAEPVKSIAALIKDKSYNFENIDLTKKNEVGYWDYTIDGNFKLQPVDKTRPQISYEPIKVEPFEVYRITGCTAWDARLYNIIDGKGKIISFCQTEYNTNITETVMIPENGAYLEINELLPDTKTKLEKAVSVKKLLPLEGKKWASVGDSWTQIFSNDGKSYVDDVAQITGVTGVNLGSGGTGYLNGGQNNLNDQFYKRAIPTDSDFCTLFGSFNDAYFPQFKFGQKGDTGTDTLWGALFNTINNAYQNNPNVIIGVISPGPWGAINSFRTDKMSTLISHNDAEIDNMVISDFAEKYVETIKEFAKLYSLPCLDLYHESNLRPWNEDFINSYYYGENATDKTHPNLVAMKKFIAPKIAKFIESFA